MSDKIEFTRNHSDLSTDQGFQFEFYCDRCGTGFRTRFQPSRLSMLSSALDAADSLLGGVFGRAADMSERVRSARWEQAHDEAFVNAMEELRPEFVQCVHCSSWICRKACWNADRGLCKQCAPDAAVEMAAAQASRTREEIWAHSKMAEEDRAMLKEQSWREGARAACPECGKPLGRKSKFCPECGAKTTHQQQCPKCGAKIEAGAKFCGECGGAVKG